MLTVLSGCFMALVFFIFLLLQRKKYNVSWTSFLIIWLVFTITGTFGASLGSALSGLNWSGKKLHGMVFIDAIALIIFCLVSKKKIARIGDYISIPIIAVCAAAKVGCIIEGCCYGTALFVTAQGDTVRFPSQIVEFVLWIGLTAFMFYIEKKGRSTDLLMPVSMIWFGLIRCLVDFFRGAPNENAYLVLNVTAGQLYSLLTTAFGVVFLFFALQKKLGRTPKVKEYLKSIV